MSNDYQYPGKELQLFEHATNWKNYFSKFILPFLKGDVLEVGAGIGETTPYLINYRVKEWTCLEPAATLFSLLTKKKEAGKLQRSCRLVHGMLDALPSDVKYDTILYIDVLEHIENDSKEIHSAISRLNQGGYLIIISPAYQFLYNPFDQSIGHYRRYNKRTIRKTVAENSLSEVKLFYLDVTGILLLVFNKLLFRKKYPNKWVIKFWDGFIIPISRLLDKVFFHSMGKSIIGIWEYKQVNK